MKGLWWEAEEYLRWPPLLAGAGYNFFMLCYTFCPETSLLWRQPLRDTEEATLRRLVASSREHGLELCMAINPFIGSQAWTPDQAGLHFHPTSGPEWFRRYWRHRRSGESLPADSPLRYGSPDDLALLIDKCRRAQRLGVRTFALCLDDISADSAMDGFSNLAEAQVWLVTGLWRALQEADPSARLLLAPTFYWTRAMLANEEYVATLAGGVPPEIDIFWTGDEVRSQVISAQEARDAAGRLGRKPVLWFNYGSNDSFRFQLLLPPGHPPAAELAGETVGLLMNPMRQVNLTRLHALVMGEYLSDPASYDHARATGRALRQLAGGEALEALTRFVHAWAGYPDARTLSASLRQGGKPYLDELIAGLERIVAELDATVPALDRLIEERDMYAEIADAAQRCRFLFRALTLRRQEQDAGAPALAGNRNSLERELAGVADEIACDARTVLETELTE